MLRLFSGNLYFLVFHENVKSFNYLVIKVRIKLCVRKIGKAQPNPGQLPTPHHRPVPPRPAPSRPAPFQRNYFTCLPSGAMTILRGL